MLEKSDWTGNVSKYCGVAPNINTSLLIYRRVHQASTLVDKCNAASFTEALLNQLLPRAQDSVIHQYFDIAFLRFRYPVKLS